MVCLSKSSFEIFQKQTKTRTFAIQDLLSCYAAFWWHVQILDINWYLTWRKKLALVHQVTSVPKQQVIPHRRWTSRSSFSLWGFRATESHREWQPWVNYYCSKPMLACVFVLKYVGVCVCVVGEALTLATGIIISTLWSSIHLQEQGLLWAHLN